MLNYPLCHVVKRRTLARAVARIFALGSYLPLPPFPSPPLFFLPSLPFPVPSFTSHPFLPQIQLGGLGERYKLPQRGPGGAPATNVF